MSKSISILAILILVVSTTACQSISQRNGPDSQSISTVQSKNTSPATEAADSPDEGAIKDPGDYENICAYGQMLFRLPPINFDQEFQEAQEGQTIQDVQANNFLKPNSYGALKTNCGLTDFETTAPMYFISFLTTADTGYLYDFYRMEFKQVGYEERGTFPEAPPSYESVNWSNSDGYIITLNFGDYEKQTGQALYRGTFGVAIVLRCCE